MASECVILSDGQYMAIELGNTSRYTNLVYLFTVHALVSAVRFTADDFDRFLPSGEISWTEDLVLSAVPGLLVLDVVRCGGW